MDVWRQRMDATTNWAAATAAGMITFTFSTPQSPHFVLLLAMVFQVVFLTMESRRYQTYDLWRRRFRTLNRHLIAPALGARNEVDAEASARLADLAEDLGRTVPHLSLLEALGYRLRRNYGYLVGLTLIAWTLKLEAHPAPTLSAAVLLERARVGALAGEWIAACVGAALVFAVVLAVRAPSEQMLGWAELPSPYRRWNRGRGPGGDPPVAGPPASGVAVPHSPP
jgi:uncharacterized membrane protein